MNGKELVYAILIVVFLVMIGHIIGIIINHFVNKSVNVQEKNEMIKEFNDIECMYYLAYMSLAANNTGTDLLKRIIEIKEDKYIPVTKLKLDYLDYHDKILNIGSTDKTFNPDSSLVDDFMRSIGVEKGHVKIDSEGNRSDTGKRTWVYKNVSLNCDIAKECNRVKENILTILSNSSVNGLFDNMFFTNNINND